MSVTFPRALVWDPTKRHHVAVIVDRSLNRLTYFCGDCDYEVTLDITLMDNLRAFIKDSDSTQVVFWGECDD